MTNPSDTAAARERLANVTLPHLERRRSGSAAARLDAKAIRLILTENEELREAQAAWDWLTSNHRLSLEWCEPLYGDDDDQSEEWRVHQEWGSINDREWDVVGTGPAALAAVLAARAALSNQQGGGE